MEIIDVTLRDGGHAVDFDWPIEFAKTYYETLSALEEIKTIELGYWGQTSKTSNMFYNLDFEKVCDVTNRSGRKNVSIMIDYHYCSHNVKDYPTDQQSEISMIRMCSRKDDMDDAVEFGKELKSYTNINVSFNIFNASNYEKEELNEIATKVKDWPFDYVYFADTHGDLDLTKDWDKFNHIFMACNYLGKKTGFHLHDHSGMAMVNYRELLKKFWGQEKMVHSTDTSVRGMGKGSGNLKLEYILNKRDLPVLADLIVKNRDLLTIHPSPYELITAKYAVTDNYAKEADKKHMDISKFDEVCGTICGLDKDSYSRGVLNG